MTFSLYFHLPKVEYRGAQGWLVGAEGQGVRMILEMVHHTRLDCALGSAGGMRRALALALNHTAQRTAFGATLLEQPLMQSVLVDVAVEVCYMHQPTKPKSGEQKTHTGRRAIGLARGLS